MICGGDCYDLRGRPFTTPGCCGGLAQRIRHPRISLSLTTADIERRDDLYGRTGAKLQLGLVVPLAFIGVRIGS